MKIFHCPRTFKALRSKLHLYDGLVAALNDPIAMLEVLLRAEDPDDARLGLGNRFGLDHIQARAVLDMQFRRATKLDRTRIREQRKDLAEQLDYLRGLAGDS
jgi:DNA gyrase subunit A